MNFEIVSVEHLVVAKVTENLQKMEEKQQDLQKRKNFVEVVL